MSEVKTIRGELLQEAIDLTEGERDETYGSPAENYDCIGDLIQIYKIYAGNKYHHSHEAAIYQVLTKIGRIATGKIGHRDNYVDAMAYLGIAYECFEVNQEDEDSVKI